MKKYFILAVAALVTFSACTKIEDIDSAPAEKITFQAASYVPQTKANSSVWSEFTSFKCKAFLHAAGYSDTQNMFGASGETITPWQSDGSTAATSEANVSYWAPSHDYYWPKDASSYVNFVAWYDKNGAPTTSSETSLVWTINGTDRSLATSDNILFADEAWYYRRFGQRRFWSPSVTSLYSTTIRSTTRVMSHRPTRIHSTVRISPTGSEPAPVFGGRCSKRLAASSSSPPISIVSVTMRLERIVTETRVHGLNLSAAVPRWASPAAATVAGKTPASSRRSSRARSMAASSGSSPTTS